VGFVAVMKVNSVIIGVSLAALCQALVIPHDVDSITAFGGKCCE
jgi:hypothetical protein